MLRPNNVSNFDKNLRQVKPNYPQEILILEFLRMVNVILNLAIGK